MTITDYKQKTLDAQEACIKATAKFESSLKEFIKEYQNEHGGYVEFNEESGYPLYGLCDDFGGGYDDVLKCRVVNDRIQIVTDEDDDWFYPTDFGTGYELSYDNLMDCLAALIENS